MALIVLSLLVGFLCVFSVLLLLISNTALTFKANPYFIFILIVVGFQRFANALHSLNITPENFSVLNKIPVIVFYFVPVYFLFFRRQIDKTYSIKNELLHFIIPTLLLLINIWYVNFNFFGLIYLTFSTAYFAIFTLKLKSYLLKKKSSIFDEAEGRKIKSWLLLMYATSSITMFYTFSLVLIDLNYEILLEQFYIYSSLLWFFTLLYMYANPVIIFGEKYFVKNIQQNTYKDFVIWKTAPTIKIQAKDQKLYGSISSKISTIILNIKNLQKNSKLVSTETLTTKLISHKLQVPKSHIDLIFKYHCHYTVKEYSNLIKIKYALDLIKNGYLSKYTIASLGEKCMFNSRFTFHQNFKKYVGISVNEFYTNDGTNKMVS